MTIAHGTRLTNFLGVCIFLLLAGITVTVLLMAGCGGGSGSGSQVAPSYQSTGGQAPPVEAELKGEWGGVYVKGNERIMLDGAIEHTAGSNTFSGSFTVDGELYDLTGTISGSVIKATLSNSSATIAWTGTCLAGRLTGSALRSSAGSGERAESGSMGLIKFLTIQHNITMGPWLLYSQGDSYKSVIIVRVGLKQDHSPKASVTVTDTVTQHPQTIDMSKTHDVEDDIGIYEACFPYLVSNRLYSYKLTVTDTDHGSYSVDASFRTPATPEDIQSGSVTSQVFYAMGDNRRLFESATDFLPFVEQGLCTYSPLVTDVMSQTCIVHNGDATCLGKHIYVEDVATEEYDYGWRVEWLKASNDHGSDDKYNHDWRYHTWLRACLPTYMSPGNHDAKKLISDKDINFGDLNLYHYLLGEYKYEYKKIDLKDNDGNNQNSLTYCVDYGGLRMITMNPYYCYSETQASTIVSSMKEWIDGANGRPIILVIHPALYGNNSTGADTGYWKNTEELAEDLLDLYAHRKDIVLIGGHKHTTCRFEPFGTNCYLLGTGGAADMTTTNTDTDIMETLSGVKQQQYADFAWGQFNIDYRARQIACTIYSAYGFVVDYHAWNY